MKKITLLLISILFSISLSFAQKDIKIASVDVDVQLINDGEGRYYCIDSESKNPIEGKLRIVQGVKSQYIDAELKRDMQLEHGNRSAIISNQPKAVIKTDFRTVISKSFMPMGSLLR